jgi:hypothetical protein
MSGQLRAQPVVRLLNRLEQTENRSAENGEATATKRDAVEAARRERQLFLDSKHVSRRACYIPCVEDQYFSMRIF